MTPITIREYISFLKDYHNVSMFAEKISPEIFDNSSLLIMTDSYAIKVSETVKNGLIETNGQMIGLKRRLDEI